MKDTLEDLEQFVIDVIIHNRRGLRASMCRTVFWFLSGIYKGAVKLRVPAEGIFDDVDGRFAPHLIPRFCEA